MKRLIAVVAILSAGVLSASENGANIFGALPVNSSDKRTIVAIPWIQASTTNGEITVADVVKTANLYEGDTIHYYNGEKYESWILNSDKTWEPATEVSGDMITAGTAAEAKALQRGNALVLMRTNDAHRANCFYLWGQVASSVPTNEIARSSESKVSSLIGPPMATSDGMIDINDESISWDGVEEGDRIYIQTSTNRVECKRVGDKWQDFRCTGTKTVGTRTITEYGWANAAPIVAGTGFWFVTTNGTQTTKPVKVIWNGAPKVAPKVN